MDMKTHHMQSDIKQMNSKIKAHRRKIVTILVTALTVILIVLIGVYLYFQTKEYKGYKVLSKNTREDSYNSKFIEFEDDILKYSNDGAFYINSSNRTIWNHTFDMQEPMVDICGEYVVFADRKGKQILISDKQGTSQKITAPMPIQEVHVAKQGAIAVLMEEDGAGYIHIYDRKGKMLADGVIRISNGGYPLSMSISDDCKRLVVSTLNLNQGKIQTSITVYGFDKEGQDKIDNIIGHFPYPDTIITKIDFLENYQVVAFGDNRIIILEAGSKPKVKKELKIDKGLNSIFYNNHYFAYSIREKEESSLYQMNIFDLNGNKVQDIEFDMEYSEIYFLQNDEICVKNNFECSIFTIRDIQKFHYKFKKENYKILSTRGFGKYIFLLEGTTEKVRLN